MNNDITRKDFVRGMLMSGAGAALTTGCTTVAGGNALRVTKADVDFEVYDLHVHASKSQSVSDIAKLSGKTGIRMGVMQNVAPWGIRNDGELKEFVDSVRPFMLWRGLQPMEPGWSKNLSRELIAETDYVLLDPQTIRRGNRYGDTLEVWEHDCYIPDAEAFMKVNVDHYLKILDNDERMEILGWPLYLPPCIARDYYRLWTEKRQGAIIAAVKARGVALEINDLAHTPHREFILKAKAEGVKFVFGSDTRDHRSGRLDYCREIASECGLVRSDFWFPKRKI